MPGSRLVSSSASDAERANVSQRSTTMTEQTSDRRKFTTPTRELDSAKQIQAFVDDYPLLSLAFMVAAGYAAGRIISKSLGTWT